MEKVFKHVTHTVRAIQIFLLLILIRFSVLALGNKFKEVLQAKVNYIYFKQRICSKLSLGCWFIRLVTKFSEMSIHGVARGILCKSRKCAVKSFLRVSPHTLKCLDLFLLLSINW